MSQGLLPRSFEKTYRAAAVCAAMALASQAHAQTAPAGSVKNIASNKFGIQVDNGWMVFQALSGQPAPNFYDSGTKSIFNLNTLTYVTVDGLSFNTTGVVFAPCPTASAPVRCSTINGQSGIGIGFGQATFGGPGGAAGGWINDNSLTVHLTNPDQIAGTISGLAIDSVNGAYAVGWEITGPTSTNHAILWQLDSAHQTYAPLSKIDLGTLGGTTSQAFGISKNARYVAGMASTAAKKNHAAYALNTDTHWTDITAGLPVNVLNSQALIASDTGFIAGTATETRLVGGKNKTVTVGFVYNTAGGGVKVFDAVAGGFNVNPLQVLSDGRVIGNLVAFSGTGTKAYHPFIFDGTNVIDFGTMTLASTHQPAFGCRVNRPNHLGELAGSCIPNSATPYGAKGTAFYINAVAASPVFIDVNAALHASSDKQTTTLPPYNLGSVSSIDDAHEITVMGSKTVSGVLSTAAFLAVKVAYNP